MSAHSVNQLREAFLQYFVDKRHTRERSSPLIPANDPTLLFTNAGMVQFKDLFTGQEKRSYTRATTVQKCVRAGGKHNDLEAVGFTKRHHTFFEMLGNFSFGDYFKEEAIEFAWEFLTKNLQMKPDHLWVSVFENDDEALELWVKISGLPRSRIVKMGEKDNFWAMGDTGPCGPCSEIYVDRGESFGKNETIFDGGDRFLEIWNLVFMQFERFADGKMTPLPKPSVDTGMGLERLASVIQNVESNYLIDGMQKVLQAFASVCKKTYGKNDADDVALRVLTDHIRACSFLIADGVQPSNEGRGYVLRRILRRAIRYGKKLGMERPFFHEGVNFVNLEMGLAYPELNQNASAIKSVILNEEEKFYETMENGLKLLEGKMKGMQPGTALPGSVAFQLYDTFGFPVDLTEVILKENGLSLDQAGFEKDLEIQRERSRAAWKGSGDSSVSGIFKEIAQAGAKTKFVGYQKLETTARILALVVNGQKVDSASAGIAVDVVVDESPFYAEGGGQVGDEGRLLAEGVEVLVEDCQKPVKDLFVLHGQIKKGSLAVGQELKAEVDRKRRRQIRINHSITHVLHATLQEVLGSHIKQAGSLVRPDYLRFDFSHPKAVSRAELEKMEKIINERILENPEVAIAEQSLDDAIAGGAKAFFDEKYEDRVRVLSIGDFSKELCGGTHAERLGEAGLFQIVSESSVSSGVRRIVAVTGEAAYERVKEREKRLQDLSDLLKSPEKDLAARIEKLLQEKQELQKAVQKRQSESSVDLNSLVEDFAGVKTLVEVKETDDVKSLRTLSDHYKQKLKSGVVIIGAVVEGKASVLVSVTDDVAPHFQMKKFVEVLSVQLGGRGGGKESFAQVGGPQVDAISAENLKGLARKHIESLAAIG
jgi:alanyl-tRNA synthetase